MDRLIHVASLVISGLLVLFAVVSLVAFAVMGEWASGFVSAFILLGFGLLLLQLMRIGSLLSAQVELLGSLEESLERSVVRGGRSRVEGD